jgi:hypothetical protein
MTGDHIVVALVSVKKCLNKSLEIWSDNPNDPLRAQAENGLSTRQPNYCPAVSATLRANLMTSSLAKRSRSMNLLSPNSQGL